MPIINPIPVKLDKEMSLKYNAWALRRFEEVTGKSLMKGEIVLSDLSMGNLIDLFWAGLSWEAKDPEPDRKHIACIMFDYYSPQEINALISQAIDASFPASSADDGNPKANLQNG